MVAIYFQRKNLKKNILWKHIINLSTLYEVLALNEQYLYSLGYRH